MTIQNIQSYEGPVFFGLNGTLSRASNTTATISSASFRDSQNQMTMTTTASTTLNFSVVGANGIDTGTIAASTPYAVYMVGDVQNRNSPAFVASTSFSAPVMPQGYSNYLRIGFLLTDGSSHLLPFEMAGNGLSRSYQWDAGIRVLNAGTSTSFAAFTLETAMVPRANPVQLQLSTTPNTAGDIALIRPTGSSEATLTPIRLSGVVASQPQIVSSQWITPIIVSSKPSLDYKGAASGSLTVWVTGFIDYIGT